MTPKRWLYLTHRWLGVALCLVMAPWFLSGIVMLYVGYPKLTDAERLAGLPALPTQGCCVSLGEALRAALLDTAAERMPSSRRGAGQSWRLTSIAGTPTYVFTDGPGRVVAVDAITGHVVAPVDRDRALATARHFAGGVDATYLGRVDEDAWTHSKALDALRPLHVVAVDDVDHRWLYVSERTGEVVRDASRVERTWGWLGAWLHWLYMFRGGAVDAWWADLVIWLSVIGTVLAITGLVVGVLRWRFRSRYRDGRHTPYKEFHARWHHVTGMLGGVLAITWVFSGLMSMNPWKVFDAPGPRPDRIAYAGGTLDASRAPQAADVLRAVQAHHVPAKELTWHRVGGAHHVLAHGGAVAAVVDATGLRPDGLPHDRWRDAARALRPTARIVDEAKLTDYDTYYVAREPHTMTGQRDKPLPVWRLRFDDPGATTAVIDPRTGEIVQLTDTHRRTSRWLFAFLHSFDLPVLLGSRPAWDIAMIVFSVFGLVLSATGIVTGWRRVRAKLDVRSRTRLGEAAGGG